MATIDEILAAMGEIAANEAVDEVLVIDANTRQINVPGSELIFGVVADAQSERKYFYCPRYVGNNLDMSVAFIRVNYRNANGQIDSHIVDDVALTADGKAVTFSWEIAPKAVAYKGLVTFLVDACFVGPSGMVLNRWHTAQATGNVLDGLIPTDTDVTAGTRDVVAQLVDMVENQTLAVENAGAAQTVAVEAAAKAAESAAVAEIEAKGTNTLASIPNDYTAIQSAVDALAKNTAPGIVCSAAGTSVVVTDASDQALAGLRIFGRSTQDGTPTPEAPVAIKSVENPTVTVCGKNTVGMVELENECFTVDAGGIGTLSYVETGSKRFTKQIKRYLPANTPITVSVNILSFNDSQRRLYLRFMDGGDNRAVMFTETGVCSETIILAKPATRLDLYLAPSDVPGDFLQFSDLQIAIGDTVGKYEPFTEVHTIAITHTLPGIPVTSGGNYTDSDGQQWICDEVDLARGVYVQRVCDFVMTGREYWMKSGVQGSDGMIRYDGHAVALPPINQLYAALCSHFPCVAPGGIGAWLLYNNEGSMGLRIRWSFDSVDGLTAFLAEQHEMGTPVTIVYPLASPIETPLTEAEIAAYRDLHTNKPNTTVLNEADAWMSVDYVADTKLYIDHKIAALVGSV